MKRFIDVHCHILPEVDDGAHNIAETKEMLKTAEQEGIRIIVATPHYHYKKGILTPAQLRQKLREVREAAKEINEHMRIFLGAEIYAAEGIEEQIKQKKALTMSGSQYVLVEFSPGADFLTIRSTFYRLLLAGYFPVLAHVERYNEMVRHKENVEDLIELGGYIQCNCGSITGRNGLKARRFVRQLLEEGMVHFIGTDAHDAKKRPPEMKKCISYIARHYGERYAYELGYENPKKLIKNTML